MTGLYQRWQRVGDAALVEASSRAIADALAEGHGRVEVTVLPHLYNHLSPLVAARVTGVRGVAEGEPAGEPRGPHVLNPWRTHRAHACIACDPRPARVLQRPRARRTAPYCRDLPEHGGRVLGGALCRPRPAQLSSVGA